MELNDINIPEMEKQRYEAIKRTNKYLEMKILIGAENDKSECGMVSKTPVVKTDMHNCSSQEISFLYITLQSIIKSLEERYPKECLISKLTMEAQHMGSVQWKNENNKED